MVVEPTVLGCQHCFLDVRRDLLEVACASVSVTQPSDFVLASRVINHRRFGCGEVVRGRHLGPRENDTERHDSRGGRQREERRNSPQENFQR